MRTSPLLASAIPAMVIAATWDSPSLDGAEPKVQEAPAREIIVPEIDGFEKGEMVDLSKVTTIEIYHKEPAGCLAYKEGGICTERSHWAITAGDTEYTVKTIGSYIKREADLERNRERPSISERRLSIRADREAPYECVQKVIGSCAIAGIYKTDAVARTRGSEEPPGTIRMWLPTDSDAKARPAPPPRTPEGAAEESPAGTGELRIVLRFDRVAADASRAVRREVAGKAIPADADLREVLRRHVACHPRADGSDGPVIIDADPQVPWSAVVDVFVLCRTDKVEKPMFAAPKDWGAAGGVFAPGRVMPTRNSRMAAT